MEFALSKFYRIDILILNAGISAYTRFEDVQDTKAFHEVMQVNYFGAVYMTRYAFPALKKSEG